VKHSTLPLLVELGCEEIPARFVDDARDDFGRQMLCALGEYRLLPDSPEPARWYSTPRRLTVWVPEVLERQPDVVEEIIGPPVKVGLEPAGRPTRAAESFAMKNAAHVRDLVQIATPKGQYLALRKTHRGRAAVDLLPRIIPGVISSLSFPKSMYWVAKSGPRFVRPIRWILALWGESKHARTIPFEIAGVKAGDVTYGHRILGKGSIRVRSFADYLRKLRQAGVELDPEKRRTRIRDGIKALLEDLPLKCVEDKWLENWIVNSTEWPTGLLGEFDRRFLHLPREILITVMRDHQKYFAVEDGKGNLQPRFVAVLNLDGDKQGQIRQGHQRVLSARFADAEFFWNADQRVTLHDRQGLLGRVTHQAELGSYADKVGRMSALASELCAALEAYPNPFLPSESILPDNAKPTKKGSAGGLVRFDPLHRQRILRAVELCKCDLTTQMVQEFPELQGVVGGLYAAVQGESSQVSEAIYDHYLPHGIEDACPRTVVGAVVSLADKIDSVVGGFAVGHEPTGSSDPFALRRQGNGIIKVMVEDFLPLPLRLLVERSLNILSIEWRKPQLEVFRTVLEFLEDRLRYYLESVRKLRYDTVRAVLAAGWDVPADALGRAEALERVRGSENFEALSLAAKRIKNILEKSASAEDWRPGEVDAGILEEGPERELYAAYGVAATEAGQLTASGEYDKALAAIAGLRPAVDRFFDKVLVMTEDRGVRQNRLRLLGKLDQLFSGVARFAEIVGDPGDVDASTSGTVKSDK